MSEPMEMDVAQAPSDPSSSNNSIEVENKADNSDAVDTTSAEAKAYETATNSGSSSKDEGDAAGDDAKAEKEEAEQAEGSSMAGSDSSSSTDIDTDDEDDTNSDEDDKPKKDPNDIVAEAVTLKEQGNEFFKAGDLNKASRSYRKGTSVLKPLNKSNTGDDQVKALLVNLQTNLSMVCFKQNKPKMSRDVASKALEIDSANVKALYRRATAKRKMGDWTEAKDDLKKALKHDSSNVAVKKELHALKKEMDAAKRSQRESLQKAFGGSLNSKSGSSFLYGDREEELQRKEEERKKKQQQEKEAEEQRKVEWTKEMDERVANGEEHVSFEKWDKDRKEKEQKAKDSLKKEQEERKKKEAESRRAAKKAAAASKKEEEEDSSDDELTAEELRSLRGYKKTSDGRTTSYFNREQSAREKQLIGDITPQRLETSGVLPQPVSDVSSAGGNEQSSSGGKGRASLWNQAGTWEEKDTTEWCTTHLKHLLKTTTTATNSNIKAVITENTNFSGDASVALTGGKKRYIFDFHTTVKYEIRDDDVDDVLASGKIKLPDISSTGAHDEDELEVNVYVWDKSPKAEFASASLACRESLVGAIRKSVSKFVKDFNEHY